jgi:hypothetical protein
MRHSTRRHGALFAALLASATIAAAEAANSEARMPPGFEIFDELARESAIRPATKADFDAWAAGANEKRRREGLPGTIRPYVPRSELQHVVLKPVRFPIRPNQFFIQSLIVAPGVQRPEGGLGLATVFYMSDFTCENVCPTSGPIQCAPTPCAGE